MEFCIRARARPMRQALLHTPCTLYRKRHKHLAHLACSIKCLYSIRTAIFQVFNKPDKPDRFSEPLNTANFIAGHGWGGSLFNLNLPVTVLRKCAHASPGIGNRPFARHLLCNHVARAALAMLRVNYGNARNTSRAWWWRRGVDFNKPPWLHRIAMPLLGQNPGVLAES